MRLELRTGTAEDTRAVGEALAALLRSRDVVILTGELGAGKTTLAQGVARGLRIEDRVTSPTFTLIREYRGDSLRLVHVDVYRLDRMQEVVDLGLDELDDGEAVLLVEWGDAVEELLPPERLRVELTEPDPEIAARRIVVTPVGRSWVDRWAGLALALEAWGGEP
jgi:tRNA threonylcarbamoyladenosine biosynthesis protein TsaE